MSRTTYDHERVESDGDHAQYYPKNPISAPIGFLYSTSNDLARYAAAHMRQSWRGSISSPFACRNDPQ